MGLKILFLSHYFYPDIGGIETNSEILAQAFTDEGHEVHLLTWSLDDNSKIFPFTIVRNPGTKKLFEEHRWADVVFENNPCLRLSWPGLVFWRPLVVALNTWISKADGTVGIQERLKFLWLKRASKVIAVSNAVRLRCWPPAIVITNPYKEQEFRKIEGILRVLDFVFLGRLVSDKGVDIALHALHKLVNSTISSGVLHSGLTFTIIGSGPDRKKLELLAGELGINDRVQFVGSLRGHELVKRLNSHRFILVPSVWEEPFGNVVLEGMACGCLPIVADSGGLPDAVGKAGLTFQRGNSNALANCILSVLNQPETQQKLLDAAKSHLANHQSKIVAKRYLQVIEKAAVHSK